MEYDNPIMGPKLIFSKEGGLTIDFSPLMPKDLPGYLDRFRLTYSWERLDEYRYGRTSEAIPYNPNA